MKRVHNIFNIIAVTIILVIGLAACKEKYKGKTLWKL
jgi:uncharacterized lipoprotein YehR (DUF1307 family)